MRTRGGAVLSQVLVLGASRATRVTSGWGAMATDGTATPDRTTTAPYVIEPSNGVPPAGWGWTRFLLLPQLLAAFYFQVRIAVSDLRLYAVDVPAALSILFWILSATATLW